MSKEVLLHAFKKAKNEIGSSKKTHLSTHISDLLFEDYKYQIHERTLRDYYTNYQKNTSDYVSELKPKLIECLCRYLGYYNYASFVSVNPTEMEQIKVRTKNPRSVNLNLILSTSKLSVGLTSMFRFSTNQWKNLKAISGNVSN